MLKIESIYWSDSKRSARKPAGPTKPKLCEKKSSNCPIAGKRAQRSSEPSTHRLVHEAGLTISSFYWNLCGALRFRSAFPRPRCGHTRLEEPRWRRNRCLRSDPRELRTSSRLRRTRLSLKRRRPAETRHALAGAARSSRNAAARDATESRRGTRQHGAARDPSDQIMLIGPSWHCWQWPAARQQHDRPS